MLLVLVGLFPAGSSLGGDDQPPPPAEAFRFPSWLDQTYTDGRITIRYPSDWTRGSSDRFGEYVDDATKITAALDGIRYLPRREYASHAEFADLAAKLLRPPNGRGTTLEYTQAARIGGRPGVDSSSISPADEDRPLAPKMSGYRG